MAASNTDVMRLAAPNFATTLANSMLISDTTMTLSSVTGLPTSTAITLTIDATDPVSGASTPSLKETVTGVVSGSTVTSLSRGLDGTSAIAHASGANVVMWITANDWNDLTNQVWSVTQQPSAGGGLLPSAVTTALNIGTVAAGWNPLGYTFAYGSNSGNKEFTVTTANNLTSVLSPGMKMSFTRGTTPPTQCMSFSSGSSQYATLASPSGITFTSAFTCEAWIYPLSYTGSAQGIVGRWNGTNGFYLQVQSTGQIALGASATTYQVSYQSVPLNQWTHVAATFSAGTFNIYINGTLVTSSLTGSGTSVTQAGALQVGAANSTSFFNGYISEARVWSVAQTQANIQANMAISISGSASNLVAYFQGNGNFNDGTSNGNNLTAQGGASATQASNPYNATEYASITAISYSNPTTTITLDTGTQNTIPNMTLSNPQYSVVANPYGMPTNLKKYRRTVLLMANSVTSSTSALQLPGASITMTIPTGEPTVRVMVTTGQSIQNNTGGDASVIAVWNGTVGSGTSLGVALAHSPNGGNQFPADLIVSHTPPSGSNTYNADFHAAVGGTATLTAATNTPFIMSIECDL